MFLEEALLFFFFFFLIKYYFPNSKQVLEFVNLFEMLLNNSLGCKITRRLFNPYCHHCYILTWLSGIIGYARNWPQCAISSFGATNANCMDSSKPPGTFKPKFQLQITAIDQDTVNFF